jgi:hypothetical protein
MLNPKYKCILAHGSDENDFVCGLFVFNLKLPVPVHLVLEKRNFKDLVNISGMDYLLSHLNNKSESPHLNQYPCQGWFHLVQREVQEP